MAVKLEVGPYHGFSKESYEWLRARGVSHRLMRDVVSDPMKVYEFYRARVDMGKSFAEVPKEYQEEVLEAIYRFALERINK